MADASYSSGQQRPDTFDVSTGAVRSQLDAAGIGPQVPGSCAEAEAIRNPEICCS